MSEMAAPVVVIGGGFIGLCSALHLQRAGRAVVLIDPGDPMLAASYGNSGQLAVGETIPINGPDVVWSVPKWLADPLGPLALRVGYLPRITPWLWQFLRAGRMDKVQRISAAMASMSERIVDDYQPMLEAAGAADIVCTEGHLRLYADRAAWQAEGWRWELRAKAGFRYETLDAAALRGREPALSDAIGFAILTPDRRTIGDPLRLMQAFRARFEADGGISRVGKVTGFARTGSRVSGVELSDGAVVAAGDVVIAAGAWSHRLTALLGDRVPLETERGYHVMLPKPGVALQHSLSHVARGFSIAPMEQGLRLAGTVEFAGLEAPPNWGRARRLIEVARGLLPGLNTDDPQFWMGHRPAMPDSLPVIDRAGGAENVVYAFGHGHLGLSWAATTGRLVASLVGRVPTNFDLAPFRLSRFAGRLAA